MPEKYNQLKAMLAITKASLQAIIRSPSAIVFSFAFPMIFILIFGFIGGGGQVSFNVSVDKQSDTLNPIYFALRSVTGIKIISKNDKETKEDLEKGRLTAILKITKNAKEGVPYQIDIRSSESVNPQNLQVLQSILNAIISRINQSTYPEAPTVAVINQDIQTIPGRTFRRIDFILPGQLGFSLLSAGVFGVAFLFFSLRQQLVLKRFFATPIKRLYIILGEAISRVIFQMITAIVIIGMGYFAFNYTLVNGFVTFLEIMALSFVALIVFMGLGFVVSGLSKNESTIPPFGNLFTLPQFLLAGTFFPIEVFPVWLQYVCKVLPLTHFNNAMRKIAFEGAGLTECGLEFGVLFVWGIVVYAVAIKVFKWE